MANFGPVMMYGAGISAPMDPPRRRFDPSETWQELVRRSGLKQATVTEIDELRERIEALERKLRRAEEKAKARRKRR